MTRTSAVLMMITACFAVTAAQQPSSQPPGTERIAALLAKGGSYFSGTDRPLSASVIGQFVSWQPGEIGLAVLLRGTERWYAAGPRSSSGGGSQGSYRHSNQFGSIRIDLTLNRTRLIATVNNVEVSLADGQNVLLVDGADTQGSPVRQSHSGRPLVPGCGERPDSAARHLEPCRNTSAVGRNRIVSAVRRAGESSPHPRRSRRHDLRL